MKRPVITSLRPVRTGQGPIDTARGPLFEVVSTSVQRATIHKRYAFTRQTGHAHSHGKLEQTLNNCLHLLLTPLVILLHRLIQETELLEIIKDVHDVLLLPKIP